MPYRLYLPKGVIHDADKAHAKRITATKVKDFKTIAEARAYAQDSGKPPMACKLCSFTKAVLEEINR